MIIKIANTARIAISVTLIFKYAFTYIFNSPSYFNETSKNKYF